MASKLLKIGFIGGGKMAQALAKGFISAGKLTSFFNHAVHIQISLDNIVI